MSGRHAWRAWLARFYIFVADTGGLTHEGPSRVLLPWHAIQGIDHAKFWIRNSYRHGLALKSDDPTPIRSGHQPLSAPRDEA